MQNIVYIKMEQAAKMDSQKVTINDIASVSCRNDKVKKKLEELQIYKFNLNKSDCTIVSVIDLIDAVYSVIPDIQISSIGETECVVEYNVNHKNSKIIEIIKVFFVSIIALAGSAFTIMSFHEDIGITELFSQISEMIASNKQNGVYALEVSYSIGLTLGILIFYNKFGRKNLTNEPSPLEVEMKSYEDTVDSAYIDKYDNGDEG